MYRLAPFIVSLLGRAKETYTAEQERRHGNLLVRHKQRDCAHKHHHLLLCNMAAASIDFREVQIRFDGF